MNPLHVIYALIVLQVLDGITTVIALRKGGSEENPIMKKLFGAAGVIPGTLAAKLFFAGLLWHFRNEVDDAGPLIAVALLYLFVVANNIKVIRKRNEINRGK